MAGHTPTKWVTSILIITALLVCLPLLPPKVVPHQGCTPTNLLGPLREPLKTNGIFGIHNHLCQSTFYAKPVYW